MVRTPTPAPTDKRMWRRLLRVVHPDTGGDHDLFIWAGALHDHVAGDAIEEAPRHVRREPPPHPTSSAGDRVDFVAAYTKVGSFNELTSFALDVASRVGQPYAYVLGLLEDCYEGAATDHVLTRQQNQGATYKQLAAIAHRAGMSKPQRIQWYRVAESIPLSQRHAGHIISRTANSEENSACA